MDKLNSEIDEWKNKNNVLKSENETLKKDSEQKMKDVKSNNGTLLSFISSESQKNQAEQIIKNQITRRF